MNLENCHELDTRLQRLEQKFMVYQSKLNSLHGKLITQASAPVIDIDDEYSDLFPIEFLQSSQNREDLILSFGAILLQPFLPPAEFKRTILNIGINAFFVKDFNQCWYQKGLLGITKSIPETAEYLKKIVGQYRHICAVGSSAGGYGAIVFGVEIGVEKIIAFSPQTILNHNAIKEFGGVDTNLKYISNNNFYFDLVNLLKNRDVKSQIDIYYGSRHERDVFMAERLKDFPFVNLYPVDTDVHNVARVFKDRNCLENILNWHQSVSR